MNYSFRELIKIKAWTAYQYWKIPIPSIQISNACELHYFSTNANSLLTTPMILLIFFSALCCPPLVHRRQNILNQPTISNQDIIPQLLVTTFD